MYNVSLLVRLGLSRPKTHKLSVLWEECLVFAFGSQNRWVSPGGCACVCVGGRWSDGQKLQGKQHGGLPLGFPARNASVQVGILLAPSFCQHLAHFNVLILLGQGLLSKL